MAENRRSDAGSEWELESPFLASEAFSGEGEEGWWPRAEALVTESPFAQALEEGWATFRASESEELEFFDEGRLLELERGIIDGDQRVRVRNALDIPCRWICQISAQRWNSNGKVVHHGPVGTGVLISPRHVLTAAHVLHNSEKDARGQWVDVTARWVDVTPARNGDEGPFGTFRAEGWKASRSWNPRTADNGQWDWALITLKDAIGDVVFAKLKSRSLCYWGSPRCGGGTEVRRLDPQELEGRQAFTAGYPEDKGKTKLYAATGRLEGVNLHGRERIMNITADVRPGQSGSPVWVTKDGLRILVGVLTRAGETANSVIRITRELRDQLREQIGEAWETTAESDLAPEESFEATSEEADILEGEDQDLEDGEEQGEGEPADTGHEDGEEAYATEDEEAASEEEGTSLEEEQPEAMEDGEPPYVAEDEAPAPAEGITSLEEEEAGDAEEKEDEAPVSALRRRIAEIAEREWRRWGKGSKRETDPTMRDALRRYWRTIRSPDATERAIDRRRAWSAAFVSWVMKEARAGDAFAYSGGHRVYIAAAKSHQGGDTSKFWAYEITKVRPEPGDLVCRDRSRKRSGPCAGTTYANVGDPREWPTHCDIVTEVKSGSIAAIGGNAGPGSNSVFKRTIKLDANGFVAPGQSKCRYFAIMKPPGAHVPTVPTPTTSRLAPLPARVAEAPSAAPAGSRTSTIQIKPEPETLKNIAKYDAIIQRVATAEGVDANILKGIIAAESGGDRRKAAASGYKGLMQASTDPDQFDAEKSIRTGAQKFKSFRSKWLGPRLKALGVDIGRLEKDTMVRWVTTAYNAGHVTVVKSVEYAKKAGDTSRWMDADHYQRALIFSGGYSIRTAATSCLKGSDGEALARDMVRASGQTLEQIRARYSTSQGWDMAGLKAALVGSALRERNRWRFPRKRCHWTACPDPPPMDEIRRTASRLLLCSIEFKHRRTPGYVNKIVAYMNHYDRRTPS